MRVFRRKDKLIIPASGDTYHNREVIKAIGNYRYDRVHQLWEFPLNKVTAILDLLNVQASPEVKELYKEYKTKEEERKAKIEYIQSLYTKDLKDSYPGLYRHQKIALEAAKQFESYCLFMETGCVSADTEYLTPIGWKRIDSYVSSDLIAQYDLKNQKAEFVKPLKYIKKPCQRMFHLKTTYGLDQMLSPEHRILSFWNTTNTPYVISAQEVFERHQKNKTGCKLRVLTAFKLETETQMDISDDDLRLQIAVIADGHFPKRKTGSRCRIRLKKQRKIQRLKELLRKTNTPYKVHLDTDGQLSFTFEAPIRTKYFTEDFWKVSYKQREIICDEVIRWDGSIGKGNRGPSYFCHSQYDADFIQYCFVSTGRRANIYSVDRGYKRKSFKVTAVGTGVKGNYAHIGKRKENFTYRLSPDGYKYCFEISSSFLIFRRNGHVFITGNTGKTLVAIRLIQHRKVPTLVVAPLSILEAVWAEETEKFAPELKVVNLWNHLDWLQKEADVYIINYEQFKKLTHIEQKIKFLIIDESSKLKDPGSQISKATLAYKDKIPYRLVMSGTPAPNTTLEFWAQVCFINPELLGDNFYRFRNTYFYSYGYGNFQWAISKENREKIMSKIKEQAIFFSKADALDLPEQIFEKRYVEMESTQREVYEEMFNENIAYFKDKVSISSTELTKLMKLREITSGFFFDDKGKAVTISEKKLDVLMEVLEEIGNHQVTIFCNFKWEVVKIKERLQDKAVILSGDVSQREKDKNIEMFKDDVVQYLIANVASAGHGLNLQNCNYVVYFSLSYSNELHKQSQDRFHRQGQKNKVTYFYLLMKETIDELLYKVLVKKANLLESCMEILKGEENANYL